MRFPKNAGRQEEHTGNNGLLLIPLSNKRRRWQRKLRRSYSSDGRTSGGDNQGKKNLQGGEDSRSF